MICYDMTQERAKAFYLDEDATIPRHTAFEDLFLLQVLHEKYFKKAVIENRVESMETTKLRQLFDQMLGKCAKVLDPKEYAKEVNQITFDRLKKKQMEKIKIETI